MSKRTYAVTVLVEATHGKAPKEVAHAKDEIVRVLSRDFEWVTFSWSRDRGTISVGRSRVVGMRATKRRIGRSQR